MTQNLPRLVVIGHGAAGLAAALNNLSADLRDVGRYQDALRAAEELVSLRRALVADDPAAHLADLAATDRGDGLALVRTIILDRVKSNPVPLVALLLGFVFLLRRRRRRS